MTPTFRQRQGQGGGNSQGNNNQNNNRRRRIRTNDGLPKGDSPAELENLPDNDFSSLDAMAPADLLKLAKKHKVYADVVKHEVIENLLPIVNADKDAIYSKGILELMNDGWGFLRKDTYLPGPEDVTFLNPSSSETTFAAATLFSDWFAHRKKVKSTVA